MPTSKRTYVRTVEAALGHPLPTGAIVHHVDGDRRNGQNNNLVALQNIAEHSEIHRKLRVLQTGGNPWTQGLCCICKTVKDFALLVTSKVSYTGFRGHCKACMAAHVHRSSNIKKGFPPEWRENAVERSTRSRFAANTRWGNVSSL